MNSNDRLQPVSLGIDVQIGRGCPYVALDKRLRTLESGWLAARTAPSRLRDIVERLEASHSPVAVGIDAPRMPLPAPRVHVWRQKWYPAGRGFKGFGRHCEVVVSRYGLGKVQWTPPAGSAPSWMKLGFALFEALHGSAAIEVFPSASYTCYALSGAARSLRIDLSGFKPGPKDMLDALVAALTVYDFLHGKAIELGGGDGLGTIVVPSFPAFEPRDPVNRWPARSTRG
jgi:predicted nuclease with RNAse H fold